MLSPLPLLHPIPLQTGNAARDTAQKAKDLLADITTVKVVQALIVLLLAYGIVLAVDRAVTWLSERVPLRFRLSVKQSLPFWRVLVLGSAVFFVLNLFLNLSEQNLLAVTGTAAVSLGFAFKDWVSSVIAGVLALFERPYQVGDRVRICGYYGEVISYGLRGIQLRTPSDDTVTIPHNKLWSDPIANASKGDPEAQVTTHFYLDHQADLTLVSQILQRVAVTNKYTQLKRPIAVVAEAQPWGLHIQLKAYPLDARDELAYRTALTLQARMQFQRHAVPYAKTLELAS